MILNWIRKNLFPLVSCEHTVIEFMGQPGSGKSSIIESLYLNTSLKKEVSFLIEFLENNQGKSKKIIRSISILILKPMILIKSYLELYKIRHLFFNEELHTTTAKKLRRLKKMTKNILNINWILMTKRKIAIHEGLAHHLQRSDAASIATFIESLPRLYGCSSIYMIYVNADSATSVNRMIRRNEETKEVKEMLISKKGYFIESYKKKKQVQDNLFATVNNSNSTAEIRVLPITMLDACATIEENTAICASLIIDLIERRIDNLQPNAAVISESFPPK